MCHTQVVPLTPAAGLIEWVEGSETFGHYLFGNMSSDPESYAESAHGRHSRPGDWSFLECMGRMKEEAGRGSTFKSRLAIYDEISKRFPPAFRHYFLERYPSPDEWFVRRLAYTRSVAVTSIVGYVVGIGDRHPQNMLIDKRTGEMIHIDFGVAFEQGKTLRTPERVPFRLTRDVIDAMGVTKTRGTFVRSCEATLAVLRSNSEALLTVCEVFMHDPLYRWTVSPLRKRQAADDGENNSNGDSNVATGGDAGGDEAWDVCVLDGSASTGAEYDASTGLKRTKTHRAGGAKRLKLKTSRASTIDVSASVTATGGAAATPGGGGDTPAKGNREADRALLRLRQKLSGYEDPNGTALSVSGQVNKVVKEAQDPELLSQMYYGWAPFL
jgi:phosphatidylinositol kinase/protein kinase (PI-3  family)